jgi:3-keto-5-aminohexanoate cleavage enzyme
MDKAVVTCALTGVLTNPNQHPVPVTAEEMARSAREAFDAGASVMHVHFRDPREGKGHLPSWDPSIAADVTQAIRDACPGVIINMSTGTVGPDISGPLACLERIRPEMAACNAGSLNYLKVKSDGTWAWPPMLFDNTVDKVDRFLKAMAKADSIPEFECFDVGIARCVGLYCDAGLATHPEYNFVMGVESGMPADPDLLPILLKQMKPGCNWQVTAIGRENIWPLQQRVAELGGMLRTGVEDTFYLPNGTKTRGNGELIDALVRIARGVGREIASPAEARALIGIKN